MKVLVIPLDPLRAIRAVGLSAAYLHRYFNPGSVAAEVRVLDVHGEGRVDWPGFGHELLAVPPHAEISAWIAASASLLGQADLPRGSYLRGFPGVPATWIEAVRAFQPDLIRGYGGGWCGLLAVELGRALAIPSLVSVHDPRGIAVEAASRASCVMAVSETVAEACIRHGAAEMNVVTVSDRVDRGLFKPEGEPATGAHAGSPRLLCVARDCEQKNLDALLEACAQVRKHHTGLILVHAGKSQRDWSRWPFVRHIDALPNSELPAWYRWADWFVLPSKWEGFGIVLAEALACGTPCITSRIGPMNQIVIEGENGMLCDPHSVPDIARCLERAASEPGLRAKLAAAAPDSVAAYDIARVEAREAALYRWLTARAMPLLSIVMPTFNREALLEGAIKGVLGQDHTNLELIVVNDGSTDGTAQRLKDLQAALGDHRLRVLESPHVGLPRALNAGFAQARGEIRGWIADDDHYKQGALRALARELMLDEQAVLVHANYEVVGLDRAPGKVVRTGSAQDLVRGNSIGPATLFRSSAAQAVGGFDPEVELAEDYDYWVKLSKVGRFRHLDRVCYEFTDHPQSLSNARRAEVCDAALRVIDRQRESPGWRSAFREQLSVLAREQKTRGLALRSLATSLQLIARFPLSLKGYWAALRALTPRIVLDASRRIRGLNAR